MQGCVLWGTRALILAIFVALGYVLGYLWCTWAPNLVVLVTLGCMYPGTSGVPGNQSWLVWPYSGMYPGVSGVPSHQLCLFWSYSCMYPRTCTRAPNLAVSVMLGYVPGYLWGARVEVTKPGCLAHTRGMYPGTKRGCLCHARTDIPGYP